jgi:ectoine hydroxylase-related dioxygenase (phytanoyl-CoA dioxygenase family)
VQPDDVGEHAPGDDEIVESGATRALPGSHVVEAEGLMPLLLGPWS